MIRTGSRQIGLDLGTANTLIFCKNKGIILREPTIIAIDLRVEKIISVGQKAKLMFGKEPQYIKVIRPMKDGAIADFDTTQKMLKYFFLKTKIQKPSVIISVPYGITNVEKRAVVEAALQAGAKSTFLIDEPLAAALGAGLPVDEASGLMIINIGGGTTEIAIISLGEIVTGRSIRIGGDTFDEAIRTYIRKKYRIEIGLPTAEQIKINIGSAIKVDNPQSYTCRGLNLKTGLPESVSITTNEIASILNKPIENIIHLTKELFSEAPPQLASDLIEKSIVLTGGGANLNGLGELIEKKLLLKTEIAEDPLDCVANGIGRLLKGSNTLAAMSLYHI